MSDLLVSVIVPVWNDERIALCLEGLQRQSLSADLFEVIVVDNGSTDATVSVASGFKGVSVLLEPKEGSYAARNTGLAHARGRYVAFTDSDCIPQTDWLEAGLAAIKDQEDVGIAAGRIAFRAPEGTYSRACWNFERYLSMRQDENAAKGFAITANWFSRRALLLEMGGFNDVLKSGGDHALSAKIFRNGQRIVYVADAVVEHPARAQTHEITGKIRRVVGGRWVSETRPLKTLRRAKVETRNLLSRAGKALTASGLSLGEKIGLVALIARIWIISIFELGRLRFGGKPARS